MIINSLFISQFIQLQNDLAQRTVRDLLHLLENTFDQKRISSNPSRNNVFGLTKQRHFSRKYTVTDSKATLRLSTLNRKIWSNYRVSISLSGLATSLFIYFTYFLALFVQAKTEI